MRNAIPTILVTAVVAIGASGTATGQPTSLADPRPSPVTSIEVSADTLIVRAAGKDWKLDGTYKNDRGGQWIEFRAGKPVAVSVDRRKAPIRKTTLESGDKPLFTTDSGEIILARGSYERAAAGPGPNAFEVDDGEIVSMTISGSVQPR